MNASWACTQGEKTASTYFGRSDHRGCLLHRMQPSHERLVHWHLVGGFNHLEKYESQLGWHSQNMEKCSKPPTSCGGHLSTGFLLGCGVHQAHTPTISTVVVKLSRGKWSSNFCQADPPDWLHEKTGRYHVKHLQIREEIPKHSSYKSEISHQTHHR